MRSARGGHPKCLGNQQLSGDIGVSPEGENAALEGSSDHQIRLGALQFVIAANARSTAAVRRLCVAPRPRRAPAHLHLLLSSLLRAIARVAGTMRGRARFTCDGSCGHEAEPSSWGQLKVRVRGAPNPIAWIV